MAFNEQYVAKVVFNSYDHSLCVAATAFDCTLRKCHFLYLEKCVASAINWQRKATIGWMFKKMHVFKLLCPYSRRLGFWVAFFSVDGVEPSSEFIRWNSFHSMWWRRAGLFVSFFVCWISFAHTWPEKHFVQITISASYQKRNDRGVCVQYEIIRKMQCFIL